MVLVFMSLKDFFACESGRASSVQVCVSVGVCECVCVCVWAGVFASVKMCGCECKHESQKNRFILPRLLFEFEFQNFSSNLRIFLKLF